MSNNDSNDDECVLQFDCDIVIVGSGSGGCVAAQVLSKAGYNVVLLEQGSYIAPNNITNHEIHALDQQYVQSGLLQNSSGTITILAGNALGGGTAINWSCCLPLPSYVRQEWIQKHHLKETFGPEYDIALNEVFDRLGPHSRPSTSHCTSNEERTKTTMPHNNMNKKLQEGCSACGYQWEETGQVQYTPVRTLSPFVLSQNYYSDLISFPFYLLVQNLRNPGDATAGYIGMGDRYGNKNGGIQSFLVEAVQCGAQIFEQCHVERICTASTKNRQRATGAECRVMCRDGKYRRMVVQSQRSVIVCAGALNSPCLLRKSGLRNSHIGKHLRLHPVAGVLGIFPRDQPVDSILGAPMTTVCNEFAIGPESNGYGAKIECPCSYPGLLAAGSTWISARQYKARLLRYRNSVPLIALQRDSGDGGSVKQSADGKSLVIDYEINRNDEESILRTLQGAARILVAGGADEVTTGHIYDNGYKTTNLSGNLRSDAKDHLASPNFQEYQTSICTRGMKDHEIELFSAHQMGTCRMSVSSRAGVVDPNGETWECDDVYLMDSSVFPTASGSNPMVTVLATAQVLSSRLCSLLLAQDKLNERAHTDTAQQHSPDDVSTNEMLNAMRLVRRRELSRKENHRNEEIASMKRVGIFVAPLCVAVALGWFLNKQRFI
jgi:choline dehydrogenase-like flavoprotein